MVIVLSSDSEVGINQTDSCKNTIDKKKKKKSRTMEHDTAQAKRQDKTCFATNSIESVRKRKLVHAPSEPVCVTAERNPNN